jgi:hypothetical protein
MDLFGLMAGLAGGRARDELERGLPFARVHQIAEPGAGGESGKGEELGEGAVRFDDLAQGGGDGDADGGIAEEIGEPDQRGRRGLVHHGRLGNGALRKAGREPPRRLAVLQRLHGGREFLARFGLEILFAFAPLAGCAREAIERRGRTLAGESVLGRGRMLAVADAGERPIGGVAVEHGAVLGRDGPGGIRGRRRGCRAACLLTGLVAARPGGHQHKERENTDGNHERGARPPAHLRLAERERRPRDRDEEEAERCKPRYSAGLAGREHARKTGGDRGHG